jgi:hypothetical protein
MNRAYKITPFVPAIKPKSKKIMKASSDLRPLTLRKANTENPCLSKNSKKCIVSLKFGSCQEGDLIVDENSSNCNKTTTVNDFNHSIVSKMTCDSNSSTNQKTVGKTTPFQGRSARVSINLF